MKTVDIRTPSTYMPASLRSTAIHSLPLKCSNTCGSESPPRPNSWMSAPLLEPMVTSRLGGKTYRCVPSQTIRGEPNAAIDTSTPFLARSLEPRFHYPAAIMR